MATTKISDLFVEPLATRSTSLEAIAKNAFFMSGVAFADPRVAPLMNGVAGGQIISMPFYNPIDDTEANIGNDDNTQKSTPSKITTGYETAVKTYQNRSFSVMDIAAMVGSGDPMVAIDKGLLKYWTGQAEKRIIAAFTGILADSVANHDSDLLLDITGKTTNTLSLAAMNTAAGYLGEYMTDIKAICVHPAVLTRLRNANIITVKQEGDTRTLFDVYGDYVIFADKNMPVEEVKGEGDVVIGYNYTSFMFGSDVVSFNYGDPGVEFEIDRDPASGNGAGEELLYTRRCDLILPRGYKTADTGATGLSMSALASAATWTRSWTDRERIKFVAVKSRG